MLTVIRNMAEQIKNATCMPNDNNCFRLSIVSTGSCATNQYIKQIKADGTVECANVPYHWGLGCSAGQYIESISSSGVPTCRSIQAYSVGGKICPASTFLRGFDSQGNIICEPNTSGWPSGSYCIGRNGSCPSGFYRVDGWLRAIDLYAANFNYIGQASFGSSSIRCHGYCGQYGHEGELHLSFCCK